MTELTKNLEKLKHDNNSKMVDISRKTGIKKTTLYKYFNGRSLPDVESLVALAKYFDSTPNELLGIYAKDKGKLYEIGLDDKVINKLNSLKDEKHKIPREFNDKGISISYDMEIDKPCFIFLNSLLAQATDEELQDIYNYLFYPYIYNVNYSEDTLYEILAYHNNREESIFETKASNAFVKIMKRSRNSRNIAGLISGMESKRDIAIRKAIEEETALWDEHYNCEMEEYLNRNDYYTTDEEQREAEKQSENEEKKKLEEEFNRRKNIIAAIRKKTSK